MQISIDFMAKQAKDRLFKGPKLRAFQMTFLKENIFLKIPAILFCTVTEGPEAEEDKSQLDRDLTEVRVRELHVNLKLDIFLIFKILYEFLPL